MDNKMNTNRLLHLIKDLAVKQGAARIIQQEINVIVDEIMTMTVSIDESIRINNEIKETLITGGKNG